MFWTRQLHLVPPLPEDFETEATSSAFEFPCDPWPNTDHYTAIRSHIILHELISFLALPAVQQCYVGYGTEATYSALEFAGNLEVNQPYNNSYCPIQSHPPLCPCMCFQGQPLDAVPFQWSQGRPPDSAGFFRWFQENLDAVLFQWFRGRPPDSSVSFPCLHGQHVDAVPFQWFQGRPPESAVSFRWFQGRPPDPAMFLRWSKGRTSDSTEFFWWYRGRPPDFQMFFR